MDWKVAYNKLQRTIDMHICCIESVIDLETLIRMEVEAKNFFSEELISVMSRSSSVLCWNVCFSFLWSTRLTVCYVFRVRVTRDVLCVRSCAREMCVWCGDVLRFRALLHFLLLLLRVAVTFMCRRGSLSFFFRFWILFIILIFSHFFIFIKFILFVSFFRFNIFILFFWCQRIRVVVLLEILFNNSPYL